MKHLIILSKHFIQIAQIIYSKVIQITKNLIIKAKTALFVGNLLGEGCYNKKLTANIQ